MATWIAHLRLAEALHDRIEGLHEPAFAMGNVAPDSGIPDEKWENFDPPKHVSHFIPPSSATWVIADLNFYHRYLAPALTPVPPDDRTSFLLGYFFHLVTDNLWHRLIVLPTKKHWVENFASDPDFIWEVKKDWYGLDFIYLRDHPDNIFQRLFLNCDYAQEWLDFLPGRVIRHSQEYIKSYYQRSGEKVQQLFERPYIYLSQANMDDFIANTTVYLDESWAALISGALATNGHATILDVLRPGFTSKDKPIIPSPSPATG